MYNKSSSIHQKKITIIYMIKVTVSIKRNYYAVYIPKYSMMTLSGRCRDYNYCYNFHHAVPIYSNYADIAD